ncbi:hypothetical protein [Entomobacter blattae]|nr:hypothetical protein [Entomobacter blattae]
MIMFVALGGVVMATFRGAIRLYFDYKHQKLAFERERRKRNLWI